MRSKATGKIHRISIPKNEKSNVDFLKMKVNQEN